MWSRETLIPGLYATEWYNGEKIKEGWLGNMEDYLVGVPRVRLLRVEKGKLLIYSGRTLLLKRPALASQRFSNERRRSDNLITR